MSAEAGSSTRSKRIGVIVAQPRARSCSAMVPQSSWVMKFGVSVPNVGPPAALIELGVAAECAGWDGFFLWDHLHLIRAMALDVHDPWVLLGALAMRTEHLRLGTLVTPVPRRRPWKLAKEVITLDHLTNGRAVLGVGLGFPADDEFEAFGEPGDDRVRAGRLDAGLSLIDSFLRGESVEHATAHYRVDAAMRPVAVQKPRPPIWVAGTWPNHAPLRRAARWDGVVPIRADNSTFGPELIESVVAVTGTRPGFDVVAPLWPGVAVAENGRRRSDLAHNVTLARRRLVRRSAGGGSGRPASLSGGGSVSSARSSLWTTLTAMRAPRSKPRQVCRVHRQHSG